MIRVRQKTPRSGFTLTELLVAIGIMALLIAILLPALRAVNERSRRTATRALMEEFAGACNAFEQQMGFPPGLVPEDVLAFDTLYCGGVARISGTENALFHLLGGAIRERDVDAATWDQATEANGWASVFFAKPDGGFLPVKINVAQMTSGPGPVIARRQYPRFFNPKSSDLRAVIGQAGPNDGGEFDFDPLTPGIQGIPDLIDAWGQPLIYLRAARGTGPLAGDVLSANSAPAQFGRYALTPYVQSLSLGELGRNQLEESLLNSSVATGIESVTPPPSTGDAFLAQAIRHPSMGGRSLPTSMGTARGTFVIISAGPDGIYFSSHDGPAKGSGIVTDLLNDTPSNGGNFGPQAIDMYDDLRVFGGR